MPYRKLNFLNNYFYHIYNRGVDKRDIFLENSDYYRFLHDLYEFNDKNPTPSDFRHNPSRDPSRDPSSAKFAGRKRDLLVEIICFVLIANHFHLILKQLQNNGIVKFMRKLGGYSYFFNKKYERSGTLFQGRFKCILINSDEYLMHLSRYIHLNPLEIIEKNWEEKGVQDREKAQEFLNNYRWSSYLDYIGENNFPSLINKRPILEYFKNIQEYKKFIEEYSFKDLDKIKDLTLD
jgi:putative transposase